MELCCPVYLMIYLKRERGGRLLNATFSFEFFSLLDFYKGILQSVGFIFSIIWGIVDMIWSEYLPFLCLFSLTLEHCVSEGGWKGYPWSLPSRFPAPAWVFFQAWLYSCGFRTVQWYTWRGGHASNPSGYIYKVFCNRTRCFWTCLLLVRPYAM